MKKNLWLISPPESIKTLNKIIIVFFSINNIYNDYLTISRNPFPLAFCIGEHLQAHNREYFTFHLRLLNNGKKITGFIDFFMDFEKSIFLF